MRKVLRRLLSDYRIEYVALEKIVFVQQRRSFVNLIYEEMKNFFQSHGVPVFEYNPQIIHRILSGDGKPTKHNAAFALAQKYPELDRYFNAPRYWQKRYYARMFDAIGAGVVCAVELRETWSLSAKNG